MKPTRKLLTLLPLLALSSAAVAAPVTLGTWLETGRDADNTFAANGSAGFTETYGTDSDTFDDSGARVEFDSPVTLDGTLNTLEASIEVGSLTTVGGSANAFRIAFRNDDDGTDFDATIHANLGYGDPGTRRDVRFAGNSNSSNEYSFGTQIGATTSVSSAVSELFTGNTANLTLTLTYLGDAGGGLHNYEATLGWDGETLTSDTFQRNTNTWDSVTISTNSANINILNDSYTVSGTQVSLTSADLSGIDIGNWVESGGDADNTFAGNGSAGFTETYGTDGDGRFDSGARADFVSDVTLDATLNTLEFSLTVDNLVTTGGENNAFRIGFENDDAGSTFDATVHYILGWGNPGAGPADTRRDARFAGNSGSSNEYSTGTVFDINFDLAPPANILATGNTATITVSLTYLGDAGGGLHNYQATIDWDGETHTSDPFTRNTDTWDKVYVLTNTGAVNVAGDSYTVGNAQVNASGLSAGTDYADWSGPAGFDLSGGPDDDDDFDGLTNAEEYAFGLDPTDPGSVSPISSPLSKATGLFTYTRRNAAVYSTGLSYTYEYSTTLSDPWTPFTPDVSPPATDSGDPVETVTVDVPDALLTNSKLFVRVVVQ